MFDQCCVAANCKSLSVATVDAFITELTMLQALFAMPALLVEKAQDLQLKVPKVHGHGDKAAQD